MLQGLREQLLRLGETALPPPQVTEPHQSFRPPERAVGGQPVDRGGKFLLRLGPAAMPREDHRVVRPADTGDKPGVHPEAELLDSLAPLSTSLVVAQLLAGRDQTTARPRRRRQVLVFAAEC